LPPNSARVSRTRLAALSSARIEREIVALSKSAHVLTPYTALLMLETEEDYRRHGLEPPKRALELLAESRRQLPAGEETASDLRFDGSAPRDGRIDDALAALRFREADTAVPKSATNSGYALRRSEARSDRAFRVGRAPAETGRPGEAPARGAGARGGEGGGGRAGAGRSAGDRDAARPEPDRRAASEISSRRSESALAARLAEELLQRMSHGASTPTLAGRPLEEVALLTHALLRSGSTPSAGPHREAVKRGLRALERSDADFAGSGGRAALEATLALAEAYRRTMSPLWRATVVARIEAIERWLAAPAETVACERLALAISTVEAAFRAGVVLPDRREALVARAAGRLPDDVLVAPIDASPAEVRRRAAALVILATARPDVADSLVGPIHDALRIAVASAGTGGAGTGGAGRGDTGSGAASDTAALADTARFLSDAARARPAAGLDAVARTARDAALATPGASIDEVLDARRRLASLD